MVFVLVVLSLATGSLGLNTLGTAAAKPHRSSDFGRVDIDSFRMERTPSF